MALQPGTRLGPYAVVSTLASGGMGEVYRAEDTRLHRVVAVKTLSDRIDVDAKAIDRFEREARAAASLNHPNICTIYCPRTSSQPSTEAGGDLDLRAAGVFVATDHPGPSQCLGDSVVSRRPRRVAGHAVTGVSAVDVR